MTTSSSVRKEADLPPLLKIRDVSRLLTVSRQTVRALIDSGDLDARALAPDLKKRKRTHVRITGKSLASFYRKRVGHELDLTLLGKS